MSAPQSVLDALADAEQLRMLCNRQAIDLAADYGQCAELRLALTGAFNDARAAYYAQRAAHFAFRACPSLKEED